MSPSRSSTVKKQGPLQSKTLSVFENQYAKLNPDQKKAVDTIEGPVMVVAGPGTGKTQVLGMRVANILRKTHMRPGNILCLTFSVSGATAMRERLRLLIGADAYGVKVSTIHAFAQSIIEENAILFDEWSARQQISDLEKVRSMNTIVDQISSQYELINPKDPYSKVPDILSRISQVKREGKSLKDLEAAADAYDAAMASKSKPGTKVHLKNLQAARKFRDFIALFQAYQSMLEKTGRYDYDDMILHVIRALEEEDWLLAGLQERYQYVLVDEFQDTNGSQYRFIELLTTYKDLPNDPNIFIVGDDDQAIYRFQGANLQNMLSFHQRFPKAPVIPLTVSYRSTQSILDAARALIERNEERLVGKIPGLQKILTAASGEQGKAPVLLRAASDTAEPWLIADIVEERIAAGTPPEEIAVLAQQNKELFPLYEVLRARNIPVQLRGKDDLLAHPLVMEAMAVLQAIEQPRSDAKLSSALACSCFTTHAADLSRLHAYAREAKKHFPDVLLNPPADLTALLVNPDGLFAARDILFELHHKTDARTALETVENVLRALAPKPSPETDPRDLAALEAFFSHVKSHCLERRACTLRELLADLRFYSDPELSQVRLVFELPHLSVSGVRLLTAHQSKGLEFETVILTNFRDGHWDKRRRPVGVSIPEDLLFGWGKDQKSFEQNQDERRIAFVAMTRAKLELIMTCPREVTVGEKSKTISPSGFFAEMGTLAEDEGTLKNPEAASLLLLPKAPVMDESMKGYLEERLKTFALSPTSLNRFLRDPEEFLRVDLLHQPEHFDEGSIRRLGYGSAAHWALRQWAVARKEGKEFGVTQFLEAFQWYLDERTILTAGQRNDLLALGKHSLASYFESRLAGAHPVLHAVEREYRTRLGDIPLKGKIDRIDLVSPTSGQAIVIDYKAGKGKSESDIRGAEEGTVSRTEDGSHFRQLAFYAVLLEQADPLLTPERFVLDYLGERGEDPVERSFIVSSAERDSLRAMIKEVWAKISSLDFTRL